MATLEVPDRYLEASPVIVTSPTSRCGTTLVQRLLSTSDNAFIHGEEVGHQIKTLTGWFLGQLRFLEDGGSARDADFDKALAGTLTDWRPGLMPPAAIMLKAWVETYYQIPATLARHAQSIGRPVWGFKCPSFSRDTLKAMLSLMPRAKVVYVFRNPFDVLMSAKARKFVSTPTEVAGFCAQWAQNLTEVGELAHDDRVLFVKYESLLAQRDAHLRLLELFTGAEGLDASVFDLKINTYEGLEADGHAPGQYIQPAALTAAERAILFDEAGPVLQRLYGDLLKAA